MPKRSSGALPKMAEAAHHPKLKEAFEKHLSRRRNTSNGCGSVSDCSAKRPSQSHAGHDGPDRGRRRKRSRKARKGASPPTSR